MLTRGRLESEVERGFCKVQVLVAYFITNEMETNDHNEESEIYKSLSDCLLNGEVDLTKDEITQCFPSKLRKCKEILTIEEQYKRHREEVTNSVDSVIKRFCRRQLNETANTSSVITLIDDPVKIDDILELLQSKLTELQSEKEFIEKKIKNAESTLKSFDNQLRNFPVPTVNEKELTKMTNTISSLASDPFFH